MLKGNEEALKGGGEAFKGNRQALTLLTLNSWAHLHPHRWIPGGGGGGGEKKLEYFVMSYLYEDTSRILAYEQIITWEGVLLLVDNTKVMSWLNSFQFQTFSISSCLVVTNPWSGIISAHIFRKSRAVLLLGGVMITRCSCYTPFLLKGSIEQAKLQLCSNV